MNGLQVLDATHDEKKVQTSYLQNVLLFGHGLFLAQPEPVVADIWHTSVHICTHLLIPACFFSTRPGFLQAKMALKIFKDF